MEPESSNINKYYRPSLRWDNPGSATPPPQKPGSVPFLWEEKPGKPKKSVSSSDITGPLSSRRLKLPPRLMAEMKGDHLDFDSPTTVLDGPDLANPAPTLVRCRSFCNRDEKKEKREIKKVNWFWRKKKDEKEILEVKIKEKKEVQQDTRLRRNRSLTSLSSLHGNGSSHFWASMRENLKQAIPWKK